MSLRFEFVLPLIFLLWVFPSEAGAAPGIGQLLQAAAREGKFSGALIVARGEDVIYRGAVGMANREWDVVNTPDTRFRISSVTKQFTAVLIMQLVEEKRIDLDAPVTKYLPDVRKETFSKVTIRNLLQNVSGLPELESEAFYTSQNTLYNSSANVIEQFLSGDLVFEPGSRFSYNNGDFIVAGAIIESVTGKSFDENLRSRILVPLKMTNTGLVKRGVPVKRLASGYRYLNGEYRKERFRNIENYGASGSMYSTVDDMLIWNRALIGHKLIGRESTAEMFEPSPKLGYVALGSWSYPLKAGGTSNRMVERQGAIGGFSSLNLIAPDTGVSITFLGNLQTDTLFRTYTGEGLSYKVSVIALDSNKAGSGS